MNSNSLFGLTITDAHLRRFEGLTRRYQQSYQDPDHCLPMFTISVPPRNAITWEERLADPMVMLRACLD